MANPEAGQEEQIANLQSLQRVRKFVVIGALVMLAATFLANVPILAYPRAFAWAVAGVVSIMEARAITKLGQPAQSAYLNAGIYFIVALLPLFRGR